MSASLSSYTQSKYDANWVFGYRCGIDFSDTANPSVFQSKSFNSEISASISDYNGTLEFYLRSISTDLAQVMDSDGTVMTNGDSLLCYGSATNGAVIAPLYGDSIYLVFHTFLDYSGNCAGAGCVDIYYSSVRKGPVFFVDQKNIKLTSKQVQEKLTLIKHADGKSWWLLSKSRKIGANCTNEYQKFLITNDQQISSITPQNIGFQSCDESDVEGEISVSDDGTTICVCHQSENILDILSFDRCAGELSFLNTISFSGNGKGPYSCQFSKNKRIVYVSTGLGSSGDGGLYQLYFNQDYSSYSSTTIWSNSTSGISPGQLEGGPNNKIFLTVRRTGNAQSTETQNLGVINQPDSLGTSCDFQAYSFFVGDSAITTYGLPNMPNYNLDATTIYQTQAGNDTILCEADRTKGATIGPKDSLPGIQYQWLNVPNENPSTVVQLVTPDTSTWYYLQITDTTIVGSCTSRIDSVLVAIENCIGIEQVKPIDVQIYPNPANSQVTLQISKDQPVIFQLYSLLGQQVLYQTITDFNTSIPLQVPEGVYIYKVLVNGELVKTDKLVL